MYSGNVAAALRGSACSMSSAINAPARLSQLRTQADNAGWRTTLLSIRHRSPISAAPIAWINKASTWTFSNRLVIGSYAIPPQTRLACQLSARILGTAGRILGTAGRILGTAGVDTLSIDYRRKMLR